MKRLPIGIQTFSKLIENNCVYVDKTALIYEMITNHEYCFLSRPRRFGKSLLVSMLANIFSGEKELFSGLAIHSLPYNWKKHPVIMISFSDIPNTSPEILEQGIKNAFDIDNISLKTLLFQTGYLTIREHNTNTGYYSLTYPNKETIDSLFEYIFASMTNKPITYLGNTVTEFLQALENVNFKKLQELLTTFYAATPYTIKIDAEKYYQTIFYVVLKMAGANIIVEQPTNIGRIDAVIQTNTSYFIIEMKINASAETALKQIREKKYYQPYESFGKNIVLVGIAFDTAMNNISEIKHEAL